MKCRVACRAHSDSARYPLPAPRTTRHANVLKAYSVELEVVPAPLVQWPIPERPDYL